MLRRLVGALTKPVRFWMIRHLSPTIWFHSQSTDEQPFITDVPRPSTVFTAEHFNGKKLVCAEIGVAFGENAESILKQLNVDRLYLIDPYTPYHIPYRFHPKTIPQSRQDKRYMWARNRLKRWDSVCSWMPMKSIDAVNKIPDNSLDFIYIDGEHSREAVKQDIDLYFPKVKKGGVMAGHDFSGDWLEIARLVMGFAEEHGLELQARRVDWWWVKQ